MGVFQSTQYPRAYMYINVYICNTLDNLVLLIITRRNHHSLLNRTKDNYFKSLVETIGHYMRKQFNICNSLLGRTKSLNLQDGPSSVNVNSFAIFFSSKVNTLLLIFLARLSTH